MFPTLGLRVMQASGLRDTSLSSVTVWTPSSHTLCSLSLSLLLGPSVLQGEFQTYREFQFSLFPVQFSLLCFLFIFSFLSLAALGLS